MNAIKILKEYQGNRSELARSIEPIGSVSPQMLHNWIQREVILAKYLKPLAKALSKALGRSVKIEELL